MRHLICSKVVSGFSSLRGSPNELWKAFGLKFLDSYSYFSFSLIFTLFLSSDFGYADVEAGVIYGAWGSLITIYGLATGCVIDNLGVSKSLKIGFLISLLARLSIFAASSRPVLLLNVLVLLPIGNCLGIPVLTVGIRRYTEETNRGFAFGLFYVVMNLAALLSGPAVDLCTVLFQRGNPPNDSWTFSGYRAVILTGVIANAVAVLLSLSVREINIDDRRSSAGPKLAVFEPRKGSVRKILGETLRSKNFWRFMVVCFVTLNVRMIFRHLDATMPKYLVREFGENVPKGTIYSINPALIIVLVPLITAATTEVDPLLMIHYGTYISAASVFFLAASNTIGACILFIVLLSVGEAVWSPRLNDYTMTIVREGREGTYMALSSAPLFLAKLPVGFISGYLLQTFCPEEGPRRSRLMWFIIGLITATSPVLLTLSWGYVSDRSEEVNLEEEEMIVLSNQEENRSAQEVTHTSLT